MNRLVPLYPDDMTAPQRAYYDAIMSRPPYQDLAEGSPLGGPFQAWVRSPTFAETIGPMVAYLRGNGVVDNRLNELAIITVGRIWSAEVEFASHSVAAIREGISEDIVEAIRHRIPFTVYAPDGAATEAVRGIGRRLTGSGEPAPDSASRGGFFSRLLAWLEGRDDPISTEGRRR